MVFFAPSREPFFGASSYRRMRNSNEDVEHTGASFFPPYRHASPHPYRMPQSAMWTGLKAYQPKYETKVAAHTEDDRAARRAEINNAIWEVLQHHDPDFNYSDSAHRAYYWTDALMDAIYFWGQNTGSDKDDEEGLNDLDPSKFVWANSRWPKLIISTVVCVMYVFCLLWLIFAIQTLSICTENSSDVLPVTAWIDPRTHDVFKCSALVEQCAVASPFAFSVSGYYSFRLVVYLLSAMPLLVLAIGSSLVVDEYIEPILWRGNVKQHKGDRSGSYSHEIYSLCCPCEWTVSGFFNTSATIMFVTHIVFGGLTLTMDAAMIMYFNALQGTTTACPALSSHETLDIMLNMKNERDCACNAIFPAKQAHANILQVSALELPRPVDLATALIVFNAIYTLYGLCFCLRTAVFWNMRNRQVRHTHITQRRDSLEHGHEKEDATGAHAAHEVHAASVQSGKAVSLPTGRQTTLVSPPFLPAHDDDRRSGSADKTHLPGLTGFSAKGGERLPTRVPPHEHAIIAPSTGPKIVYDLHALAKLR